MKGKINMTKELIQKFLTEVPAHPVPKTKICVYDNQTRTLYMPDGTQKSVEKTTKLQNDLATAGYQIKDIWRVGKNDHPFGCMGNVREYATDIYDVYGKTIIELSFFEYCAAHQKWSRTTFHGEQPRYLIVATDKEIWYNDRYLAPKQKYDEIILPESATWYNGGENMFYDVSYNDFRSIFFRCSDKEIKTRLGCEYLVEFLDEKYQEV
jgi:hypothetical protein